MANEGGQRKSRLCGHRQATDYDGIRVMMLSHETHARNYFRCLLPG